MVLVWGDISPLYFANGGGGRCLCMARCVWVRWKAGVGTSKGRSKIQPCLLVSCYDCYGCLNCDNSLRISRYHPWVVKIEHWFGVVWCTRSLVCVWKLLGSWVVEKDIDCFLMLTIPCLVCMSRGWWLNFVNFEKQMLHQKSYCAV